MLVGKFVDIASSFAVLQDVVMRNDDTNTETLQKHLVETREQLADLKAFLEIPQRDIPTLGEQFELAKSDPVARARLEELIVDAEFDNTEIEFH